MEQDFDVIIVGSGVAGALTAWQLANEQFRVLILEAGERGPERVELVGAYARASLKTPGSPYKGRFGDIKAPSPDSEKDYYEQSTSADLFKSTYQRRIGGSTWHWLGNVPRLIPNDFRMKSVYGVGVDWPITYDELEPWYCEAEQAIGVSGDHAEWNGLLAAYRSRPFPMSKIWSSYGDTKVAEALVGVQFDGVPLALVSTPQARNSQPYDDRPACAGNSSCVPICPIQAKYDATVHLAKAEQAKAILREKSVVTRLEVDEDRHVRRVIYKSWDGQEHTVSGRIVVIAAHAIETAKLLLMSACERTPNGVANSSDQVGRNLMDHLQGAGAALALEPLFPFRGPPTTSGIDNFRDGAFRSTRSAFRMSIGNDGWGRVETPYATVLKLVREENLFGNELKERLAARVTRQFRISYSTEMLPNPENRVTLSDQTDGLGIRRPKLHIKVDEYNKAAFESAWEVMETIFTAMKATEIRIPKDRNDYSGAGHIMGTCRMGNDSTQSVVDSECRAHDHPNLFILGASVFPTCGTANPTLTVAALALRAAKAIKFQLAAEPAGNDVTLHR
jgi:choline dehydrogenase-like flavoprotein